MKIFTRSVWVKLKNRLVSKLSQRDIDVHAGGLRCSR
jgi:hypothetical protein